MPVPTIGPEFAVSTDFAGARQVLPTVAATTDGRFTIAYHDLDNPNGYQVRRFDADGTIRSSDGVQIPGGPSSAIENRVELAALLNNEVEVVYLATNVNDGDIFHFTYRPSSPGGVVVDLSTSSVGNPEIGPEEDPSIAVDASGRVTFGFIDTRSSQNSGRDLVTIRDGTATTHSIPGDQVEAEMTFANDRFVRVYRDLSSGNVILDERGGDGHPVLTLGPGSNPHVATLADGGVAVAWQGVAGDVLMEVINVGTSAPTVRSAAAVVDGSGIGSQSHVCALQDGRLLVVWQEVFISGQVSSDLVLGRLYQADGTADSSTFTIDQFNFPTGGEPVTGAPRAAQLADGRIVVTYQDGRSINSDIKAKILDPRLEGVAIAGTTFDDDHVGTAFADVFVEGVGNDRVAAGGGNDSLFGGRGADILNGEAGNDILNGGLGDDAIDGGSGVDEAVFSGARAAYTLTNLGIGGVRVSGPDGTDTVVNVERLVFLDMTLPWPPVPSDFNGDIKTDIVFQAADGRAAIWLMDGTSLAGSTVIPFNPGPPWKEIDTGDFNADGKSDIVFQNSDGRASIWQMDGATLANSAVVPFNPGADWHLIATGDFNPDTKSDIVFQNIDGRTAIWLMNGPNLVSSTVVPFNPGASWKVIDSGDFNADGKADILFQNDDGRTAVWQMDGTNLVGSTVVAFNPGASWKEISTGDFNADSKSDILFQNADGRVAVWLMDGSTIIDNSVVSFNPGASWKAIDSRDFNSDGKADIVFQNDDGRAAIWLMDGTTFLGSIVVPFNPGSDWHMV